MFWSVNYQFTWMFIYWSLCLFIMCLILPSSTKEMTDEKGPCADSRFVQCTVLPDSDFFFLKQNVKSWMNVKRVSYIFLAEKVFFKKMFLRITFLQFRQLFSAVLNFWSLPLRYHLRIHFQLNKDSKAHNNRTKMRLNRLTQKTEVKDALSHFRSHLAQCRPTQKDENLLLDVWTQKHFPKRELWWRRFSERQ